MIIDIDDKEQKLISFIIISGGQRPESMERLIKSIEAQNLPEHEIVVIGLYEGSMPKRAVYIEKQKLARSAAICKMRNLAMETAKGDILILLDDDISFPKDWYENIKKRFDEKFDVAGCRVITPAGDRWYDWAWGSRDDLTCPTRKLDYSETGKNIYIGGCLMIICRHVFKKVKFDENLKNHQRDDVDFCHRVWDAGFTLKIFREAHVTHHLDPAGRSDADPGAGSLEFSDGVFHFRLKRFDTALNHFKKMPDNDAVKSKYHSALCLVELGRKSEAETELKYVISMADKNGTDERRFYYSANFHLGRLLEGENRKGDAMRCYRETLEGFKEHHEASLGLARLSGE